MPKYTERSVQDTQKLVEKVQKAIKADPETTAKAECDKVGLSTSSFFYHNRGKVISKKYKGKKRGPKKTSKLEFQQIDLPVAGGNHLLLITPDRDLIEKVLEKYRS